LQEKNTKRQEGSLDISFSVPKEKTIFGYLIMM